ncbi:CoA-disulfide reductase [Halothermothrix orenii]|uniref:FAD-dependent pyridine nucleotide-disulphide oxidoreductase n=1 Tax=Halothermothrix orenii (strain H 168 / OCM 544 / DSM 9562) TaxID=373903 RepID=B8D132_HALOH|nr:FAD-dependent pyridine nucleotide-disulphide oxidoreductase [Halothermothrix orenii H 168]
MGKKIVIVGGVAGGASTAARLRRLDEEAEIIIMEKGDHISFANCGLPYHIGGVIKEREKLLVQTPESMEARFNIDVRVRNEVVRIDRDKKEIKVRDLNKNEIYCESYDFLILSPGAEPIKPPIDGVDFPNVFTLRNIPDTDNINEFISKNNPDRAVVVGGGFIGLEMAENLQERGLKVSLVEMAPQVMGNMDYEMAAMIHNHLREQGIDLHLNDGIASVNRKGGKTVVVLQSGREIETDLVIMAIGVRPSTKLAREAGLEIGESGGIKVNEYLQTSDRYIYAIGDAIEVIHLVTGQSVLIPLAGPANKQGRIVANIISGKSDKYKGTQGTAVARVFNLTVASTGASEKLLKKAGRDYLVSYTVSKNHAGYYPGAKPMTIKLLFTPDRGVVLGAQIVGYEGVDKRIDLLATAVRHEMTVYDLQELELAYAPPFGSAKDPVNMAGYTASNILDGLVEVVYWDDINNLDKNTILLDVREEVETQIGSINGSVNIPLNSLRERLDELDKDKDIIVYCAMGLRGYIGYRILKQHGFKKVKNLSGGYKLYKAVQDDKSEEINTAGYQELNLTSNPGAGRKAGEEISREMSSNRVKLDACGLQCPGPIMQVYHKMEELKDGDILEVTASDPGFLRDVEAWCDNTGNTLVDKEKQGDVYKAVIKKGRGFKVENNTSSEDTVATSKGKTMVVFSGELDKAIASFIIANGAASMGNKVTMFFTFWGLNILRKDRAVNTKKGFMEKMFGKMMPRGSKKLPLSKMNMMGLGPRMIRKVMEGKGVDSLESLIKQARENGVNMVACQMSMDVMGIKKEELIDGVEVGGVASFLGAADKSNMSLFI